MTVLLLMWFLLGSIGTNAVWALHDKYPQIFNKPYPSRADGFDYLRGILFGLVLGPITLLLVLVILLCGTSESKIPALKKHCKCYKCGKPVITVVEFSKTAPRIFVAYTCRHCRLNFNNVFPEAEYMRLVGNELIEDMLEKEEFNKE